MGLVVTVVGAHAGVGTSLVAAGLAAALADGGYRPVHLLDLADGPPGAPLAEVESVPSAAAVLDSPPTYDDHVLDALRRSERVLVVATPDGASLETLALVVESYALLGLGPDRVAVVLNRVTSSSAAGVVAGELRATVETTVLGALPDVPDLDTDAATDPREPFGDAVRRLASAMVAEVPPTQPVLPFRRRERGR